MEVLRGERSRTVKRTTRWTLALAGVVVVVGSVWLYRRVTSAAPDSVEVRPR